METKKKLLENAMLACHECLVWLLKSDKQRKLIFGNGLFKNKMLAVPNIPVLNPNSLRSVYDVKTYVVFIAIRPSDRYVKPGGPLDAFR